MSPFPELLVLLMDELWAFSSMEETVVTGSDSQLTNMSVLADSARLLKIC